MSKQKLDLVQLATGKMAQPHAAMPNPGLCRIDLKNRRLALSWQLRRDESNRHSPRGSETFQESQQVIVGLKRPGFALIGVVFERALSLMARSASR